MPRKPRMYLAGVPAHVIQRGNNRRACFFREDDYRLYRQCLTGACARYGVALHAYVLMTNHVHLLMTPERADGISRVMQSLGRRYVQYVNKTYRRTGTLWEGRHKATLVEADSYLVACYRYIELNPVRAGMVSHPEDYRWSSYRANACGEPDASLTEHAAFLALGSTPDTRCAAYRELSRTELKSVLIDAIRRAAACSVLLGSARFKEQVERALGRSTGQAYRGRPRSTEAVRPPRGE